MCFYVLKEMPSEDRNTPRMLSSRFRSDAGLAELPDIHCRSQRPRAPSRSPATPGCLWEPPGGQDKGTGLPTTEPPQPTVREVTGLVRKNSWVPAQYLPLKQQSLRNWTCSFYGVPGAECVPRSALPRPRPALCPPLRCRGSRTPARAIPHLSREVTGSNGTADKARCWGYLCGDSSRLEKPL